MRVMFGDFTAFYLLLSQNSLNYRNELYLKHREKRQNSYFINEKISKMRNNRMKSFARPNCLFSSKTTSV